MLKAQCINQQAIILERYLLAFFLVINSHNLPAGSFPDSNGEVVVPEDEDNTLEAIFYQQTVKHLLEKGLKPTGEMQPV